MDMINTTYGWNLGDDLIREGVLNIAGIDRSTPAYWLDRAQNIGKWPANMAYRQRRNAMQLKHIHPMVTRLVIAGTPEWGAPMGSVYRHCSDNGLPILVVGVGGPSNDPDAIQYASKTIQHATARDQRAYDELTKAGIKTRLLPCPAFHASYPHETQDIPIILGYRCSHANQFDGQYRSIFDRINPTVVTVHEPNEIYRATELFGDKVFYHSDFRAYKSLYARAQCYIGGRIHGAIPVLATGGKALLMYERPKAETVKIFSSQLRSDGQASAHVCRHAKLDMSVLDSLRPVDVDVVQRIFEDHQAWVNSGE